MPFLLYYAIKQEEKGTEGCKTGFISSYSADIITYDAKSGMIGNL